MNSRLSIAAIATQIKTSLTGAHSSVHVGTGYDRGYIAAFAKTWPAVWVAAQRLSPRDDGGGYSGMYRQRCKVEVAIRVVVQRYADGSIDGETRLNALHDAVSGAITGWQPSGADAPMVWESSSDGDMTESLMSADLIFSTSTTYAKAVP